MTRKSTTERSRNSSASGTISGSATADGTKRFAARFSGNFASDFYRSIPSGLTLSSIGMGTYLGECDDTEDQRYADVLTAGVSSGLNVLDTAINFRCQRSERAVGRAIRKLLADGIADRDELIICTKGGYVPLEGAPPESRSDYDAYLDREYLSSSVMSKDDIVAGGHCVTPRFLADQIERSRQNLGVDRIDVFYLHNPEQQLDSLDRKRFTASITNAFTELESQVEAGHIDAYGCATWNGFRVPPESRNHLSLSVLTEIATSVGGKSHHFRFVQLPVNLAMTEAIRAPVQDLKGKPVSLLDLATQLGISVVASATLMQSQLTQNLPAAARSLFPDLETDAQRAIAFVRSLPVTTALVGMRSSAHLEENIGAGNAVIRG
jgi:aryl-alcohol dehydrogenase-like predicted oxidoreductase